MIGKPSSLSGRVFAHHDQPARAFLPVVAQPGSPGSRSRSVVRPLLLLIAYLTAGIFAHATVTTMSVQSPRLSVTGTTNVTSPIHFQVTAESNASITGYVVYVDSQNVFRNFSPSLDAWVILPPGGTHWLLIKAWDSAGSVLSTVAYSIHVQDVAPPTPPVGASRLMGIANTSSAWIVDNNNDVGGQCNDGSIGTYASGSSPNTLNAPNANGYGQHFHLSSKCQYDDSLFYWKYSSALNTRSNFLWDFWFYIPASTQTNTVEALEFDLFQALQFPDGVHEFMFGSQCNYASNQWQFWLPQSGSLTWVDSGLSPCRFSPGTWHHATYFFQRVTSSGYQQIPKGFSSTTDPNTNLRFGTLTVDGKTLYLGGLANSTIPSPPWGPTFGVQHQLDSAVSGVNIDEYVTEETVTAW